tara:strand:+ start:44 stop:355 length:312 start_codon:yes stop_codon:yes gene_type:complete
MGLEDLKARLVKRLSGGKPSDAEDDAAGREMMLRLLEEKGKTMSDADKAMVKKMLGQTSAKPKPRPFKKGGKVMGYKKGGAVKKKSKMGCVMAGRGGKYKGMS